MADYKIIQERTEKELFVCDKCLSITSDILYYSQTVFTKFLQHLYLHLLTKFEQQYIEQL